MKKFFCIFLILFFIVVALPMFVGASTPLSLDTDIDDVMAMFDDYFDNCTGVDTEDLAAKRSGFRSAILGQYPYFFIFHKYSQSYGYNSLPKYSNVVIFVSKTRNSLDYYKGFATSNIHIEQSPSNKYVVTASGLSNIKTGYNIIESSDYYSPLDFISLASEHFNISGYLCNHDIVFTSSHSAHLPPDYFGTVFFYPATIPQKMIIRAQGVNFQMILREIRFLIPFLLALLIGLVAFYKGWQLLLTLLRRA